MIKLFLFLSLFVYSPHANNRANQMNPNNDAYWQSRGYDSRPDEWRSHQRNNTHNKNRANHLNPNNSVYWKSRSHNRRPADWERRATNSYDNNRANQLNPNNFRYQEGRQPVNATRADSTNLNRDPGRDQTKYQKSMRASHANQERDIETNACHSQVPNHLQKSRESSEDDRDELPLTPMGYLICGTILFAANYREYFG